MRIKKMKTNISSETQRLLFLDKRTQSDIEQMFISHEKEVKEKR